MSFIETPRFPEALSFGFSGGPRFFTDVVELESGHEQRNQIWSVARGEWRGDLSAKPEADRDTATAFFRAVAKGRMNGFRFKDWNDFTVTVSNGLLGTGAVGNGGPTYQLYKRYTSGAQTSDRLIAKPVSGGVTVYRNASPVTVGAGAGQIAIDSTTGIVTFVADASGAITGHTPGASHQFTTAADITGLAIGELVYITGVTGTGAATLNNIAHTISNKTGTGPYTWTISTTTTGLTTSDGTAFSYPQAADALTWAGEFDVPVRMESDAQDVRAISRNASAGLLSNWENIVVKEIRV